MECYMNPLNKSRVSTWANEKNEIYVITTPFLKNICASIKNEMISVTCPYYKIVIALILNNQGSCSIIKSFATRIDDISSLIFF